MKSKRELEQLIHWSKRNFSHLPWRKERSLYSTLVSEIMLQQTTVSTVLKHYEKFLKKYPTLKILANASEEELAISWKGLGYYRRAKNLKSACRSIDKDFLGVMPLDKQQLLKIPGIGDYTAGAILAIGANKQALALDANLERVLARYYGISEVKGPRLLRKLHQLFNDGNILKEMQHFEAREVNEALMDLGRTYCQARKASCSLCPVSENCYALKNQMVQSLPTLPLRPKSNNSFDLHLLRIIVQKNDGVLAYKKSEKQWLSGQWELPTFVISCEDESFRQYPTLNWRSEELDWDLLPHYSTAITKYKIRNTILAISLEEFETLLDTSQIYRFLPFSLSENFSTASFKAMAFL